MGHSHPKLRSSAITTRGNHRALPGHLPLHRLCHLVHLRYSAAAAQQSLPNTAIIICIPYFLSHPPIFSKIVFWESSGKCGGRLSKTDRLLMCWWAFTGLTHIMEGTYAFAPKFFSNQNPSFFDEVWKEYSKGDSRYVARDPATVTVEAITAVLEGPASLLSVYATAHQKSDSHILQFTLSLSALCMPITTVVWLTKGFAACSYAIAHQKSDSHILQFTLSLSALCMLGLLHYCLLGWLQLLG